MEDKIMKKTYNSPKLEVIKISVNHQMLTTSSASVSSDNFDTTMTPLGHESNGDWENE